MQGLTVASVQRMFDRISEASAPVIWFTTLRRIKLVCRMNGLTVKQAGRIVKKVAYGRMNVDEVFDHLDAVGTR